MDEWAETQLEDITSKIGSGATPRGGANSYKESGITLIRSQNVLDFRFTTSGLAFIDDDQAAALQNVEVLKNDVLLNITGDSVARCCIVPDFVLPARVNQHVAIIRLEPNLADFRFIFYHLQYLKNELLMQAEIGATRRALTKGILQELEILLPPLPEQRAIAGVLSALDDKIDLLNRQNDTLEALAQTLFRQWFVEEAEDDWGVGTLGEMIEIFDSKRIPLSKMERNKMKEGRLYPYYGAAKIMDYVNDYIFDGEYILFGEDGTVRTDEGYPVLQYATGKFWVNNHTHVIQAKKPYTNFFLWNYLKKKNITSIVTGAVQPKINQTNLKSLDFPKYPIELVKKFNQLCEPLFEKTKTNNQQIQTLEKLRDTLLPKLMSGEVRVM